MIQRTACLHSQRSMLSKPVQPRFSIGDEQLAIGSFYLHIVYCLLPIVTFPNQTNHFHWRITLIVIAKPCQPPVHIP